MKRAIQLLFLSSCMALTQVRAQSLVSGFETSLVMDGWYSPVGATWDANGRMYVWEKSGRVWIVENGVKLATPLLNLLEEVGNWADHGMLGFALDPNYLTNGRMYAMYVVDRHHLLYYGTANYSPAITDGGTATIVRIVRYTATGPNFNVADPASRTVLLGETITTGAPILYNTHGAGTLLFARDGTLLATIGEASSAASTDVGSATESYYAQALADGIIRPEENVGAFRSQMVNSFSGKVLRMDPNTGNGVPSNPFYDPAFPRAAKSRVWAMGLRNPYRMTLKPNTGSTDPADGDVGTLFIGDVGWSTWEEQNVCTGPGQNFGWPLYEGFDAVASYQAAMTENQDASNPQYNGVSCTQRYFRFIDLLKQDTPAHANGHPNPCDASQQVPPYIPHFFHKRPAIDWLHGNRSRCGAFNGTNAITYDLDEATSPISGPRFGGYASIAGPWSTWSSYPAEYQNSAFHADFASGWIRRFVYDAQGDPVSVHDFADGLGMISWLGAGPDGCLYYFKYGTGAELRRICNTSAVNLPPIAAASQSAQFGPGPLTVDFSSSGSSDPENGAITYLWNFGDGSSTSSLANPSHQFTAPPGQPAMYTVTLTVTDNVGQQASRSLIVSVNNTPPNVSITSITNGAFYPVGVDSVFQLAASVTDAQHGPAQLSYAWQTTLVHNSHEHPGPLNTSVSGSTVTSGEGCDGQNYSYRVSLTVTDAHGLSATDTRYLYPRCYAIAPVAVIQLSALAGVAPLGVQFDGTGSYDPGTIVSYFWDFGDGTTSTSSAPNKTFTSTGDRVVTLRVTDNDGLTGTASRTISVLTLAPPQCAGASGGLLRQYWTGIGGTSIPDLVNHPNYPNSPSGSSVLTSFQGPTSFGNNYGTRVRGFIVAPETGAYTFTVTSDDASAVYLSPNAEARHKALICSVPGNTLAAEYTKYTTQVSAPIQLVAGAYYFVELLHKEGSSTDHFALYWQTPSNSTRAIIPGSALVQWADCPPGVRLRANLSGPFDAGSNLMRDDLRAAGYLPLAQPYSALGYAFVNGGGSEATTTQRLQETGPNAVVDWVVVELRNKNTPSQVLASRAALLERDGDVVGTDGYARLNFILANDNYFVAIRHRNHLAAMTAASVKLDANEAIVDLTLISTTTYGTQAQRQMANDRLALWSGDVSRDGNLRYVGNGNDRDPILTSIGGFVPSNTVTGYRLEDVDMSGVVKYTGAGNDRDPILFNIGGSVPTQVRFQQLP